MDSIRQRYSELCESSSFSIVCSPVNILGAVVATYVAIGVLAYTLRVVRKHGEIVKFRLGMMSNPKRAREVAVVAGDMLAEIIHEEMFGEAGHAYLKHGVVLPTKFIRDKAPALVIDVGANIGLFGMSMEIFGEEDLARTTPACRVPQAAAATDSKNQKAKKQQQQQEEEPRRSVSAQRRSASAARKSITNNNNKVVTAEAEAEEASSPSPSSSAPSQQPLLPAVRVIGFEPIPETFECCRRNYDSVFAATNKAYPEHASRVLQCGIGERAATARFRYDPTSSAAASMHLDEMTRAFAGRVIEAIGAWMIDLGRYPLERMHSFYDYLWAPLFLTFFVMGKLLKLPFFPARLFFFVLALPLIAAVTVFRFFAMPGARDCDCQILTLPEALRKAGAGDPSQPIAFLKIDVEGAEESVCNGIDAVTWARVHQAVVEVHDTPDGRLSRLVEMLRVNGFKKITVDEEPLELHKLAKIKTIFATRG
jgi:hypothetical protein